MTDCRCGHPSLVHLLPYGSETGYRACFVIGCGCECFHPGSTMPLDVPPNVFMTVGSQGITILDQEATMARLRVMARLCEYCGREPCACPGPEKSEWCVWCEGWRRLTERLVHPDEPGVLRVCADCWDAHGDSHEEDEDAEPRPRWRRCCIFCDAPEAINVSEALASYGAGGDLDLTGLCTSPECRRRLKAVEARAAARKGS